MGGIFSSPKAPAPPPAPPPPEPAPPPPQRVEEPAGPTTEEKNNARKKLEAERIRQANAKGRASTILTSGQGVTDEVQTTAKKLLGE